MVRLGSACPAGPDPFSPRAESSNRPVAVTCKQALRHLAEPPPALPFLSLEDPDHVESILRPPLWCVDCASHQRVGQVAERLVFPDKHHPADKLVDGIDELKFLPLEELGRDGEAEVLRERRKRARSNAAHLARHLARTETRGVRYPAPAARTVA